MNKYILSFVFLLVCIKICSASTPTGYVISNENYSIDGNANYFVDPDNGSDVGAGNSTSPWKTLGYALNNMSSFPATINLYNGDYGDINTSVTPYSDWVTIVPVNSSNIPVIRTLKITGAGKLRIDNVMFTPGDAKSGVYVQESNNVELRNISIVGTGKYLSADGISIRGGNNILILNSDISKCIAGIKLISGSNGVSNCLIRGNYIHDLASTAITYERLCNNVIIERNHIYSAFSSSAESTEPGYYPHHGSGISLRDGNVLIRENIFRTLGTSSGIMTYSDTGSAASYSDIYIHNNLFYDIFNIYVLRFYRAGENIEVINNTIVGSIQPDITPGVLKLGYSIVVHEIATGHDGSSFIFANNILAGLAVLPEKSTVANNIIWSFFYKDSNSSYLSELAGNIILTSGEYNPISYFTTGFFKGVINLTEGHGTLLDYRLVAASPAVDAGTVLRYQSIDITGYQRGYVQDIGCYEYRSKHINLKANGKLLRVEQ